MFSAPQKIPLSNADCYLISNYLGTIEADQLFQNIVADTEWSQPSLKMFGQAVLSPRMAAWVGDEDATYVYSGLVNSPAPWTACLNTIRQKLQQDVGVAFNSVLLNLYRDGKDAMGWHADDEPELGDQPVIASLSLGATRRFLLRPAKKGTQRSSNRSKRNLTGLNLEHGSLLVMKGEMQKSWQHSVSRTTKQVGPRVNLTFRYIP